MSIAPSFPVATRTLLVLAGTWLSSCSPTPPATATNSAPNSAAGVAALPGAAATPSSGARADSLNGIPGHHFGEPLRNFPGLVLTPGQLPGRMPSYYYPAGRRSEAGWFGNHRKEVAATYYMFQGGQFAAFQATAFGPGRETLRQEAHFLLGPGQDSFEGPVWTGQVATAGLTSRVLELGPALILDVVSVPLNAELRRATSARLRAENAAP